jgi:predicted enzyme related to lactoylglutathione lyase
MNEPVVVQFEITGRNPGRLHSFYRSLFGWQLHDTPGGQTGDYKRTSQEETGVPSAQSARPARGPTQPVNRIGMAGQGS